MLTAAHLTRRFGPRLAVDDVSFELAPGEILALLGPNGSGKTTTLRMLAGLIAASSGTVQLDGETLAGGTVTRLHRRVGFLTEAPGLWDGFTVRENLLIHARLHGLAHPERAVDAGLDLFDIRSRAGDRAAELSKGLKQRVALARALLHDPDVVLLDEPTSGLDPESARAVRDLVLRLRSERRAVLLATHNLDEVDRVADRVAVLRTRLVASGTPAALRARLFATTIRIVVGGDDVARYIQLLQANGAADVRAEDRTIVMTLAEGSLTVPHAVRLLVEAGAAIAAVVPAEPSLEDVYLRVLELDGGRP